MLGRIELRAAALAAFLAAVACDASATTFTYSGATETWVAPTTGTYAIALSGSQGGGLNYDDFLGGLGAEVRGHVHFTAGQTFTVVVGGLGSGGGNIGFGGGGASWLISGGQLIAVAGGGGGAAYIGNGRVDGKPGEGVTGGSGQGGHSVASGAFGGGGAGWLSDGEDGGIEPALYLAYGTGGKAPLSFEGGTTFECDTIANCGYITGGFGGGGGAGWTPGGGGGGYTGGDSALSGSTGGNSYLAPDVTHSFSAAGVRHGSGVITIDFLGSPTPEPATWALMVGGFGIVGATMRRRRALIA